jgi:hypothetical protein
VDHELYLEAERILDDVAINAGKNIWHIESADCVAITGLPDLHEKQLSNAPVHATLEAHQRVLHFGKSARRSLW